VTTLDQQRLRGRPPSIGLTGLDRAVIRNILVADCTQGVYTNGIPRRSDVRDGSKV
jgi:hypothetical protein